MPEAPSPPLTAAVVAAGGALGSVGRYLASLAAPGQLWPTLAVNLTGAFALGVLAGVLARRPSSPLLRPFLGTGVIGGFTTFSALAVEVVDRGAGGRTAVAAGYVAVTVVGGVLLTRAGWAAGERRA
jgi:CrcB protein